jgi:hypothetical protein
MQNIVSEPVGGPPRAEIIRLTRRAALVGAVTSSAALALAAAAAVDALDQASPVAWVRAAHADGWVWSLKTENYRGGRIVAGDPLELDDYAMHRPDGRPDDTEQLIAALQKHEQWRRVSARISR